MRIETCWFCSQPCYPSKAFRKAAGKELVVDKTLLFAARRNVPVRYNREHVATTLKAMKRVAEVRAKRERVFYKNRMAGNKERVRAENLKLVVENQHLLPRVRASEKMVEDIKEPMELAQREELPVRSEQKNKIRQLLRNRQLVGGGVQSGMDLD
ncbi:MAG: hypothetical protein LQ351_005901 [Letrouitia transgressa]|nr:MAG: hypothetical protein LQ351_005901 [Letrouitia transgressa]